MDIGLMYISSTLQSVAVKVFPETSQFDRSRGLDAKQLPLKYTRKRFTEMHPVKGSTAASKSTHSVTDVN